MRLIIFILSFLSINLAIVAIDDATMRLVVASVCGIIQTVLILIITGDYNFLNIFPLSMLVWMVQFPLAAFALTIFRIPLQYEVTNQYLALATSLANVGQLFVAITWQAPFWGGLSQRLPRPRLPALKIFSNQIILAWTISIAIRLTLYFSGFQPGFEVEEGTLEIRTNLISLTQNLMEMLPILGFCAALKQRSTRGNVIATVIVICELLLVTLFTGTKSGPLITIFSFLAAYHYVIQPIRTSKTWMAMVLLVLCIVPFYAVKSNVRWLFQSNYGGRQALTLNDYEDLYEEATAEANSGGIVQTTESTLEAIVHRVDVVSTLAATIAHYRTSESYDTIMYLGLWERTFIPRFIWPEKGRVTLAMFVTDDVLGLHGFTAAAVDSTIEGYIAGGILGVVILSIMHGALAALTTGYLLMERRGTDNSFYLATFASIYLFVLYFNQSFNFVISIAIRFIILWLFCKLFAAMKNVRFVDVRPERT